MNEIHILNLGAGVQSTALYLMDLKGELDSPRFDYAIFADTQEEPDDVYRHLAWLESLGGAPVLKGTSGKLGNDLIANTTGQRFAAIPAFTSAIEGLPGGLTRRQCTKEYKVDVVGKIIRRQLLGLIPRQRIPKDVHVHQYFGLSFDEPKRVARVSAQFDMIPWATAHFPLWDDQISRHGCKEYLLDSAIPHDVPRSACVFCPFKTNAEWRRLRDTDRKGWARAVEVDEGLRAPGAVCNRGLNQRLYVHRSCVPLRSAPIDTPESRGEQYQFGFAQECEGMCGL
jgi:hypothetical protein